MTLDNRDLSILTQVAFKAAVETVGVSILPQDDGHVAVDDVAFSAVFGYYQDSLLSAVTKATSVAAPKPASGARPQYTTETGFTAADMVRETFPGTVEVENEDNGGFILKAAKGEQNGAFPAWLIADCQELGITEVWDNRPQQGNRPIFKEAMPRGARGHGKDGDAKAWWPPK